jgi:hypothetical protein
MSKFALLFLLVFFGGIAVALINGGASAFIVYELVYFLNPGERWWAVEVPELRYSLIMVILMIVALIRRYRDYSSISPWSGQVTFIWMAALLVMYYFAYLFALNPVFHHRFTFEFTKLIIIMFIAYKLVNSEVVLNACLWAYLLGCTYIGFVATSTGRNSGNRVEGIGMVDSPDANGTAAALVPAAVLLMYFAWQGNMKVKLMAVFMGALIANGLVLINSRGSFLGVVVSLGLFLMYMIFSRHQRKGQKSMAIFMIILGLSGALYITDDQFWQRMETLKEGQDGSSTSRIVFWFKTFDMLKDHPLGMGIYGYNTLAPLYMDDATRGGVELRSVHSMWFQGLGEVGWIGFGIFLSMLISLLKLSLKAKRFVLEKKDYETYFKILTLECALLGFLVSGTFINRFRSEILYWMILFLAIGVKIYYLQPNSKNSSVNNKVDSI